MNRAQFIIEAVCFGLFFYGMIFGVPWAYYILTGKYMEF